MPSNCYPSNSGPVVSGHTLYALGHNPIVFFKSIPAAECAAKDVAVNDLTAQSGPFWTALQDQSLPAFSWVTPNAANDNGGGPSRSQGEQKGDAFLQRFMANVQQSNSYQAGNTMVVITYDEGLGSDSKVGEDCTDKALDLPVVNNISAHQESCHIPTFVVYPYTSPGDADPAFFDLYSITRTVEDLFGLPYLAHAGDAQTESLVGHFGIPARSDEEHPSVTITAPDPGTTATGTLTVSGTATSDHPITAIDIGLDDQTPQPATGTENWTRDLDTTTLTNGEHTITVQATDSTGDTGTATTTITVSNPPDPPPTEEHPSVTITAPDPGTTATGTLTVSGTATSDHPITAIDIGLDDQTPQPATGTENWTRDLDTTTLTNGEHTITVQATDSTGDTGTATTTITVSNSAPSAPIGFVGDSASAASTTTARTTVPTGVHTGDQLILIGSYTATGAHPSTPAGWTLASTRLNGPLESYLWTRRATDTDAGNTVTTTTSTTIKSALLLAAYRNVATTGGLADIASSADTSTATHTSPRVTAPADGWVIQAWTDKSSGTTAWTPPTGPTTRASVFGTGGGRASALLTDSGTTVTTGPNGNQTARSNSVSGRGITWTLALKPAAGGTAANEPPHAAFTVSCPDRTCTVNGSGSTDPDGSVASYAWTFGDGDTATGPTPTPHTYSADGPYTIALTVTDNQGLTHTTTHDVDVTAGTGTSAPIGFVGDSRLRREHHHRPDHRAHRRPHRRPADPDRQLHRHRGPPLHTGRMDPGLHPAQRPTGELPVDQTSNRYRRRQHGHHHHEHHHQVRPTPGRLPQRGHHRRPRRHRQLRRHLHRHPHQPPSHRPRRRMGHPGLDRQVLRHHRLDTTYRSHHPRLGLRHRRRPRLRPAHRLRHHRDHRPQRQPDRQVQLRLRPRHHLDPRPETRALGVVPPHPDVRDPVLVVRRTHGHEAEALVEAGQVRLRAELHRLSRPVFRAAGERALHQLPAQLSSA